MTELFRALLVHQLGYYQTWLLYHNALSSGVEIDDILKHARRSKDVVGELRAQVAEQQDLIRRLLDSRSAADSAAPAGQESEQSALLKKSPTVSKGATSQVVQPIPAYGSTAPSAIVRLFVFVHHHLRSILTTLLCFWQTGSAGSAFVPLQPEQKKPSLRDQKPPSAASSPKRTMLTSSGAAAAGVAAPVAAAPAPSAAHPPVPQFVGPPVVVVDSAPVAAVPLSVRSHSTDGSGVLAREGGRLSTSPVTPTAGGFVFTQPSAFPTR